MFAPSLVDAESIPHFTKDHYARFQSHGYGMRLPYFESTLSG